jgi:hypothetical protein
LSNSRAVSRPWRLQLGQLLREEAPLRVGCDELEGALVGAAGVFAVTLAPEQLRTGGVEVVVLVAVEALDDREPVTGD